jgi:amidohydrolase
MKDYQSRAEELFPYTRDLRREFHRCPELGFKEIKTSKIIQRELNQIPGLEVRSGVAKTGVIGRLEGASPGKTILLRFDMDALPIQEETGLEFASQIDGKMHACGHDGHMAIGLTVARILAEDQGELSGKLVFLFQPAEEGLGGASQMIQEGALRDPKPDIALALHLWNEKNLGWLGITDGPVMAASDTFYLRIIGKGGHGGKPQEATDPIVAAAGVVNAIQSIISREIHPLDSGVITVSTIHGGEAQNVIPEYVALSGTIRSLKERTREHLLRRIQEIAENIASAYQCGAEINFEEISPTVVNDPEITEKVRKTAKELYPTHQIDQKYQTMASEDMAWILQEIPGCYFFLGSANPEKGLVAKHHQPDFSFDEDALIDGVALLVGTVHQLLDS